MVYTARTTLVMRLALAARTLAHLANTVRPGLSREDLLTERLRRLEERLDDLRRGERDSRDHA